MDTITNACEVLLDRRVAGGDGTAVCIREGDRNHTYEQVLEQTAEFAGSLAAAGIDRGDVVLIVLPDGVLSVVSVLGAIRRGATAVLLSNRLKPADYRRIAADCTPRIAVLPQSFSWLADELATHHGARFWLASDGEAASLENELHAARTADAVPIGADDVALIQYTSGSTGEPSGVMHRHPALTSAPRGVIELLDLQPDDVVLSASKLAFGYGFGSSVLAPMLVGASSVLAADPFDLPALATAMDQYGPSILFSVPTVYAALLNARDAASRYPLADLRAYVSSGEYLGAELGQRCISAFGPAMTSVLGCTETLYSFAGNRIGQWSPDSIGDPLAGYELRAADARDGVGMLEVRGPGVAAGYLNRPARTAEVFRDGWVRTGDMVGHDEIGRFRYLGRNDDVLKIGGARVSPVEIEDVLRMHPDVAECAVVGVPDNDGLPQLVAYVVPVESSVDFDSTRKSLRRKLRDELVPYRRPKKIEVVR